MAKLVIITLDLIEARALLHAVVQHRAHNEDPNQYHGATQVAVNKLDKAVKRASTNERSAT